MSRTRSSSVPGVMGAVSRFWTKSHAPDYAGLGFLICGWILLIIHATPFHRLFTLSNLALAYPHATTERVPVPALFLYAGITPLLTLLAYSAIFRPGGRKTHVALLGLATSIFLTLFLTDVIKNAVGRPRPDLLARCVPREDTPRNALVDWHVCTQDNTHKLHDGWRSFPSGHSSFSFAGLGYVSLFFAGQMGAMRPRADLGRVLVAGAPLLGALLIAISRCEDYRHDVWDVTAGSVLGFGVAWGTYRRYYPGLTDVRCAEPYEEGRRGEDGEGAWELGSGSGSGDGERLLPR